MTTQQLNIDASQAITELQKINDYLRVMSENSSKAGESSKKAGTEIKEAAEKGKDIWTELNSKIEVFNKVILGGIGYLTKFKDTILEMEGFQTQATALSLLSKNGENLNNVLQRSVEITKGVVNQYDLLAVTNTLMMKGFNLSEDALEKLIDVSATYSSTTGESVRTVMEKIAQASQRERDSLFEKMGVYINTKKVLSDYAKTMGTTVDKLDEATKSMVLLDTATSAMKERFDDLGLSATSLESPITHTFKRAETAITQAKDAAVGLAASIYVDLVNSFEYLFLKASGMTNEALWKIQDESDAKNIMAALTSEMNKLVADEADKLVKFSKLPFQEQEKLREQSTKDTEEFAAKQEELLNKVQKLKDTVGVGAYGDAYGFISQDTANLIQKLEKDVASIGSKAVQKAEMIKALKSEVKSSWVNFADLPSEKEENNKSKEELGVDKIRKAKIKKLEEDFKKRNEIIIQSQKTLEAFLLSDTVDVNDLFDTTPQMKMMQEQGQLQLQIEKDISDRKIKIKQDEKKILLEQERRYQETAKSYLFDAANTMYSGLISGRENFLQETISLSMQRAGAEIFNDGLIGLWQGGRWALSPYPTMQAQGLATIGYSLAEIAAGIGLGYAGAKAMPSVGGKSESKNKETASRDRSMTNNTEQKQAVVTYLYPDERTAIQQLSKVNKKM